MVEILGAGSLLAVECCQPILCVSAMHDFLLYGI